MTILTKFRWRKKSPSKSLLRHSGEGHQTLQKPRGSKAFMKLSDTPMGTLTV